MTYIREQLPVFLTAVPQSSDRSSVKIVFYPVKRPSLLKKDENSNYISL